MPNELVVNIMSMSMPPTKATPGSAAFDCYSNANYDIHLNTSRLIDLGFKIAIPEGYVGKLFIRSGLSRKGLTLANSVGVIDPDYRGPVMANVRFQGDGFVYHIEKGDRICQLIIEEIPLVSFRLVDDLDETTRGSSGFGSTGIKWKDLTK
jgi:dUTP pyrophosphatase